MKAKSTAPTVWMFWATTACFVTDELSVSLTADFSSTFKPQSTVELIPFDSIYLPAATKPLQTHGSDQPQIFAAATIAVEVLVRETASGPWIWIPGEMRSLVDYEVPSSYGMAVVQWWNKIKCQDIVPVERIRWRTPGPGGWWGAVGRPVPPQFVSLLAKKCVKMFEGAVITQPVAVTRGAFFICSFALPEGFECSVVKSNLQSVNCLLSSDCMPFCCIDMAYGRLWRIQRRSLGGEYDTPEAHDIRVNELLQSLRSRYPSRWTLNTPMQIDSSESSATWVGEFPALSVELWLEVFSHLDTREQNRFRVVCSAWNCILTTPILTASIVLVTGDCGMSELLGSDDIGITFDISSILVRWLSSTVFHSLRPSTKHIILSDRQRMLYTSDLLNVVDVMNYVGKHNTGIRFSAIY
ncbi:uncharacterized protein LOC129595773 isoform X1 [Paramacrobiotus metropolitanus]|uniref:uncharacterized protein LOC129595773 isoform X1 n=1 Tax=Paramacrobiotus metropolitanus TaxID=2943436 RepID=UPI0024460CD7|nr:uncharacterized protein LOC129595773 isoform X1 [Paramacrobiotus metropolitanus]XP_055348855.1 uncharacterized protein LOC129595773 isoform X1 [Paramacrobiotus metropolitanus]